MYKSNQKSLALMIPKLRYGGAERVVSRLSFALRDYFDLSIIVFDEEDITYDIGCKIIPLKTCFQNKSNGVLQIINTIIRAYTYNKYKRRNKVDITYSFGDSANLVNILSSGRDKKVVSIRGFKRVRTKTSYKSRFFLKPLSRYICAKADNIIVVSRKISEVISKTYGIPGWKIAVVYNGYDLEEIRELSLEPVKINIKSNKTRERLVITAGTFRPEKGYWHLIKAFCIVEKKLQDVKLLILGEDLEGYVEKVKKLAKDLGISDKVIYLGYQSNPFAYFSKADVYVLSSVSEGFPNSMVEAMACGLPVVAYDCDSGPREILNPQKTFRLPNEAIEFGEFGILVNDFTTVEDFNPDSIGTSDIKLSEAIICMLEDDKMLKEYSSAVKQRVREFNYKAWVEEHLKVLEY